MELTRDNYYTVEADREYMSCSQYQSFLECEAATMARLYLGFQPKESEALLVGNYVHTALEGDEAHEEFIEANIDKIFKLKTDKKTGDVSITGKYAAFEKADEIIRAFLTDPLMQKLILMDGECERIMTGTLFGVPWKIRLDKYIPTKRIIVDYKTAADLTRTEYNVKTGERECFLESAGYLMRAAVYSEIEKQVTGAEKDAAFIILAVTKQEPVDKGAYLLNHRQRYDWELEQVRDNLVRILEVKSGRRKPTRCGHCEYCRKTKKLKEIVPYYTIKPGFEAEREEEYDAIFAAYMEEAQG